VPAPARTKAFATDVGKEEAGAPAFVPAPARTEALATDVGKEEAGAPAFVPAPATNRRSSPHALFHPVLLRRNLEPAVA
jgi:hypothetical protein